MQNDDVYHELQQQIDKMPGGMPPFKSGVEIRILKHLFTPEEAKLALHLNIFFEPLNRIYSRVKRQDESMTLQEVEQVLDQLVMKGSILADEPNGEKRYSYAMFVVGMYEFQVDHMTREFYEDCDEYTKGEFRDEFTRTGIPQLRVVPVEQSIPIIHHVATYDDIRHVINEQLAS
jgi:electron transport complex protein RnfB